MELIVDNDNSKRRIVLRLSATKNTYTVLIPTNWNVRKLRAFISYTFKDAVKDSIISLYHEGKKLPDDFQLASIITQEGKYAQFIITAKPVEKEKSSEQKNINEILKSKQFNKVENMIISEYGDNSINKLPLMSMRMNSRMNVINEATNNQYQFEFSAVENFPIRGYFKFELLFKLLLFFFLFGIQMKGYNIPIFISFLIIYYW